MEENTHLEDENRLLGSDMEGASHQGTLYLRQRASTLELSPQAQWDLLEWLYSRRYALYRATHVAFGQDTLPAWVQSDANSATRIVDTDNPL